jgi:hypothetical protein
MGKNISLAIGVADPGSLSFVNGAINGAKAFKSWAEKLGYESSILTDDDGPVTVETLRRTFESIFQQSGPIHRFLLYFAGHGMLRDAEERLWFLSNWNTELKVVHVEFLRRRLMRYYDIQQIAIFADACSVLPAKIEQLDLSLDGVVSNRSSNGTNETQIDRFDASQDGDAAFMLPFQNPDDDRGIFTGVLLQALWGTKVDAFSKIKKGKITSASLGSFLKSEVPRIAKLYNRELKPRVNFAFSELDDIYFETPCCAQPPAFPEWPQPESVIIVGGAQMAGASDGVPDEFSFARDEVRFREKFGGSGKTLINQINRQRIPQMRYGDFAIRVEGFEVKHLWTVPLDSPWRCSPQKATWLLHDPNLSRASQPVLIEFSDGMFAAFTALPNFVTHLVRTECGISGLVYHSTENPDFLNRKADAALAAMENGTLGMEVVTDFTTVLRQGKHRDPLLGVISAYLYDSIGDLSNIRRMGYYYFQNHQSVPYDIALLAQVPSEMRNDQLWIKIPAIARQNPRTPAESGLSWTYEKLDASEGPVAGFWPWMRQGWTYLSDPMDIENGLIRGPLANLTNNLSPGRFVMVDQAGGRILSEFFGLDIAKTAEILTAALGAEKR